MRFLPAIAAAVVLAAPAPAAHAASWAGSPSEVGGLAVPARVHGDRVELSLGAGRFAPRFWAGVNLGATVPGTQPGELAVSRARYDRWLAEMGRLGVRVVRVYTLMRPRFYAALAAYNERHPHAPVRLLQGIYLDEDRLAAQHDLYDEQLTGELRRDLREAVAAVHGDGEVPVRPGRASGTYRASVARWLLGWSVGVEWDPLAVDATDRKHAGTPPYEGRYVTATAGATPTESWLASNLDLLAAEEARRGYSTPLTFTNWVTADPLEHPGEPLEEEDLASVDAEHVRATPAWPGGTFASYHVYPYYPDFLGLGAESYPGYLARLREHHAGRPVMITELGVPSSYGISHHGPLGRDQGGHTEREQGRLNAGLMRDVRASGAAGAVLFAWIDEWFKRTWNTMALEVPADRRQLWRNDLTNEQHFGVLAADPAPGRARRVGAGVRAAVDAGALTLTVPTRARRFTVGVDARPGDGGGLPGTGGAAPAADVALVVDGRRMTVLQAGAWEPTGALYGERHGLPTAPWQRARLLTSHPLHRPDTGERIPARVATLPPLPVRRSTATATLRIPWALLGFSDPSSRSIYVVGPKAAVSQQRVAGVRAFVPAAGGFRATRLVGWAGWDRARWRERRKASWPALRGVFRELAP